MPSNLVSPDQDIASYVDAVRRHYDDGCFACGRDNPIGLHLDDFSLDEGEVAARFLPRSDYRGSAGGLHGGVTATALDEILVGVEFPGELVFLEVPPARSGHGEIAGLGEIAGPGFLDRTSPYPTNPR